MLSRWAWLPNRATRLPDAAWVEQSRWAALTTEERERFPPLCPDFVVELRSPSDALAPLQAKLREYLANGARLGWLLNRQGRAVVVYRAGQGGGGESGADQARNIGGKLWADKSPVISPAGAWGSVLGQADPPGAIAR